MITRHGVRLPQFAVALRFPGVLGPDRFFIGSLPMRRACASIPDYHETGAPIAKTPGRNKSRVLKAGEARHHFPGRRPTLNKAAAISNPPEAISRLRQVCLR